MSIRTGSNIIVRTYICETSRWWYIPIMIYRFYKGLPNTYFKLFPRFRINPVSKGYQLYSRNFT
jgi:hypothetical protein